MGFRVYRLGFREGKSKQVLLGPRGLRADNNLPPLQPIHPNRLPFCFRVYDHYWGGGRR